jgi:poly(A) polymerase
LRLSNAEAERLQRWALTPPLSAQTSEAAFAKMLYRGDQQGLADRLKLALSSARASASLVDAGGYSRLLRFMDSWERPTFPISGKDLMEQGAKPGKALGDALKAVEGEWVDGGFKAERGALLARATQLLGESQGQ